MKNQGVGGKLAKEKDTLMSIAETTGKQLTELAHVVPVLPLRDVVVFPHMVIPLYVGRPKSIKALEASMSNGKQIFLVAQKSATKKDPDIEELYRVGVISTILQLLKLPDGTVKVLVEGNQRGSVKKYHSGKGYLGCEVSPAEDFFGSGDIDSLVRSLMTRFEEYIKINRKIPPEIITSLTGIDDPGRLADTVAAHMTLKIVDKQKILEANEVTERLRIVLGMLEGEIELLQVEQSVQKRVKGQMEHTQREYYLNEKLKAIQKELGTLGERPGGGGGNELDELGDKINKAGMSKEAKDKALSELDKLRKMPPMSAEATVSRNYVDWLLAVPWKKRSKITNDLLKATKVLDADHYGLEKVKERIVEYLAVQQRVKVVKGPILCLVGPPGVGKTSLGQSIANATGRKFIRISLGGIRDEAEIRGHRRTYIGSLPGKIVQKIAKVSVRNPLFMLDEVDKMAMDFRGDPASALLEVLDPEQNYAFNDHYLEIDYDLSDVMFITTANSLDIPPPLLDRMEVIRLPGYTEDEKRHIAMKYLVPKQIKDAGLKSEELVITEGAAREIIRHYTREAGVRNLEREISKICRKVVKEILIKKTKRKSQKRLTAKNVEKYLGVKRFRYGLAEERDEIGQVTGLAWTEVGGELLKIEAAVVPGKGQTTYTGRLGDVMQESIQAAMTVVRSRATRLGINDNFAQKKDIHVHVPEGATPKDGPSAGIGMCTALVSALTKIPVHADVAMTGEITLRGEVLPIGGLKEKLIAALRGGIKKVIIPEENSKDLKEIPQNITRDLEICPVKWIDQVFELALVTMPKALAASKKSNDIVVKSVRKSSKHPQDQPPAH